MQSVNWRDELVERLARSPCCGYSRTDAIASEPSALTALALAGEGRLDCCEQVAKWLQGAQAADGSVAIRENERVPCWTTSLAVLAWSSLRETDYDHFALPTERAIDWIVNARGVTIPREQGLGHDSSIVAWPWVDGTHAWVEPTALHVLALKAVGLGEHARTRDAVRMLFDRQVPGGGFNYGNTFVLDRPLRPHLQPTGVALLALASETDSRQDIRRSLSYLRNNTSAQTTTTSLCWSLLALAAHHALPSDCESWLEISFRRTLQRDQSPLKLALILLALQGEDSFAVKLHQRPPMIDRITIPTRDSHVT